MSLQCLYDSKIKFTTSYRLVASYFTPSKILVGYDESFTYNLFKISRSFKGMNNVEVERAVKVLSSALSCVTHRNEHRTEEGKGHPFPG